MIHISSNPSIQVGLGLALYVFGIVCEALALRVTHPIGPEVRSLSRKCWRRKGYYVTMGDWEELTPLELFRLWLTEAESSEPNDPNAAALAFATADGKPSVRMVLVKRVDERGFCFFTNSESQKGDELDHNPQAALCFHWKSLRMQVHVEGRVGAIADAEVDAYFHSRSRRSQISAAVSQQSRPLASRQKLQEDVQSFAEQYPGEVPRPLYWKGFCVAMDRIEFWSDGPDRLHDRILSNQKNGEWKMTRLSP